ncbi:MAG TPA: DNA alkylation repair protein [Pseudomonadales bacterium]
MTQTLLKHSLDRAAIDRIGRALAACSPEFCRDRFTADSLDGLAALGLKQRVQHIIDALHQQLPADFAAAATLLHQLPDHWDDGDPADSNRAMAAWPLIDYAAVHGLDQPAIALPLLARLTPLFTAEYAIRPFLQQHFALSYRHIEHWCHHPDAHVRRLASEGLRPRLPWGEQLLALRDDPAPIWPVIGQLLDDDSLYVRKSVANNLNDISKDHPALLLQHCRHWLQQDSNPRRRWIVRHGLRSLVKQGQREALALLGFAGAVDTLQLQFLLDTTQAAIGDDLLLQLQLANHGDDTLALAIDYIQHYPTASGRRSRKVFKLKTLQLAAGASTRLEKRHRLRTLSTRRLLPGTHCIELMVNGRILASQTFVLA